jgi:hypothetical protein
MVQRGAGLSCSPFPNNSPARPALGKGIAVFADEERVELARRYANNPQLFIIDVRNDILGRFNEVFQVAARTPRWWQFREFFSVIHQEWRLVDGPPAGRWAMTPANKEYLRRFDQIIIAATMAAKRSPLLFREFEFRFLQQFRNACGRIVHGHRKELGEAEQCTLGFVLARFEEWIQLSKNDGEEVPPKSVSGNLGPAKVDAKTIAISPTSFLNPPSPSGKSPLSTGSSASVVSVNAQMLDVMQSVGNEVCLGWSVEDWREKLGERFGRKPAKSTIHKQPTWDLIRTLRVQSGVEAREHQTTRDQTGKRRSRMD